MALYAESGTPLAEGAEPAALGSSETFEDFYAREFPAVVGLAYGGQEEGRVG
jgi:hypothetical protein